MKKIIATVFTAALIGSSSLALAAGSGTSTIAAERYAAWGTGAAANGAAAALLQDEQIQASHDH